MKTRKRIITRRAQKQVATVAAAALLTLAVAGCSTGLVGQPEVSASANHEPPVTPEEARDTLMALVDEAAKLVGGNATVSINLAADCLPGLPDGVQFQYAVGLPVNSSAQETLERVASRWTEQGVSVVTDAESVYTDRDPREPTDGAVAYINLFHYSATGEYQVAGYSTCVPGSPEDFTEF